MTHFLETYNEQPNELTPIQVANILHCTQMMLYRMFASADCELEYYRVGSRYWITKSSVRAYILNHHSNKKQPPRGE